METRKPDAVFDADTYLKNNPDVWEAMERGEISGANEHFNRFGIGEGREAYWTVIGQDRTYQCDAILIDGVVDVMSQYWALVEQTQLDVRYYIVSNDPEKFGIPADNHKVILLSLGGGSPHTFVHYLVPNLQSDYIVFSIPCLVERGYVRSQINRLQNSGREVLVRVGFDHGNLIIVRRSTFLDMGGFRDMSYYYLEDLIQRAKAEERPFDHGEVLRSASADHPSEDTLSLRDYAIGYKRSNVEADVVIPFYGHVDFVEEAVQSVIEQENADTVVHLVDDCSRDDTTSFMKRWKTHSRVRVYRNNMNIGQFMTVNNLVPFFETNHLVFLDGDDVSVSQRVWEGINLLDLTRSDLFGSRIKMFGDEYEWSIQYVTQKSWVKRSQRHWNCTYPHEIGHHYFPNTSLIMTKKSFVDLGGFTDFGDVTKNKTANDTELLYRYFYGGYGTCYSVSGLVNVRRHTDSCTQNMETGWTTPARMWAHHEVEKRRKTFFEDRKFIPRSFGGLGQSRWDGVTERWES